MKDHQLRKFLKIEETQDKELKLEGSIVDGFEYKEGFPLRNIESIFQLLNDLMRVLGYETNYHGVFKDVGRSFSFEQQATSIPELKNQIRNLTDDFHLLLNHLGLEIKDVPKDRIVEVKPK